MSRNLLPPPSAIDVPEPVYGHGGRPPSPLRNSFSPADADASFSDDGQEHDEPWGRPHSPTSSAASITQMASAFTQRLNALMSPSGSSTSLPSDAQLEADAARERARSRAEAERILMAEAEQRRSQTLPPQLPPVLESSPGAAERRRSGTPGWWDAAKQRLTPTKEVKAEPLTPAQQVALEARTAAAAASAPAKKPAKGKEKERARTADWPAVPADRSDPAFAPLTPPRRPPPTSQQSSPALSVQKSVLSLPGSLAPSPAGKAQPPLYAQFTPQGTLDANATLLAVARRFEKLERWAVSHVRALEERMGDVERWLVEREQARTSGAGDANAEAMEGMRAEMAELQGRILELGRQMARLSAAPPAPAPAPSRSPSQTFQRSPSQTSHTRSPSQQQHTPRRVPSQTHSRAASLSPPFVPPTAQRETPKSRLPYPTGDYAPLALSPPASPPGPALAHTDSMALLAERAASPPARSASAASLARAASPPAAPPVRSVFGARAQAAEARESVSPTPRKRYTVALKAADDDSDSNSNLLRSNSPGPMRGYSGGSYSSHSASDNNYSASEASEDDDEEEVEESVVLQQRLELSASRRRVSTSSRAKPPIEEDSEGEADETIGKSAGRRAGALVAASHSASAIPTRPALADERTPGRARARPMSMMVLPGASPTPVAAAAGAGGSVTPLRIRSRSVASARSASPDAGMASSTSSASGSFVDPYTVRAQERAAKTKALKAAAPAVAAGKPRAGVRDMAKFFDRETRR